MGKCHFHHVNFFVLKFNLQNIFHAESLSVTFGKRRLQLHLGYCTFGTCSVFGDWVGEMLINCGWQCRHTYTLLTHFPDLLRCVKYSLHKNPEIHSIIKIWKKEIWKQWLQLVSLSPQLETVGEGATVKKLMSALGAAGHMDVRLKVTKLLEKNCQELEEPEKWSRWKDWVDQTTNDPVMSPPALPSTPLPEATVLAAVAPKCALTASKCAKFGSKCAQLPPKCAQTVPKCARHAIKCAQHAPNCAQPANAFSLPIPSLRQYSQHSRSWCMVCAPRCKTVECCAKAEVHTSSCTKSLHTKEPHALCATPLYWGEMKPPPAKRNLNRIIKVKSCAHTRKICGLHSRREGKGGW